MRGGGRSNTSAVAGSVGSIETLGTRTARGLLSGMHRRRGMSLEPGQCPVAQRRDDDGDRSGDEATGSQIEGEDHDEGDDERDQGEADIVEIAARGAALAR